MERCKHGHDSKGHPACFEKAKPKDLSRSIPKCRHGHTAESHPNCLTPTQKQIDFAIEYWEMKESDNFLDTYKAFTFYQEHKNDIDTAVFYAVKLYRKGVN